jgi:hypothetical protein
MRDILDVALVGMDRVFEAMYAKSGQVVHLARISDKVWRRFSVLLWHESPTQDTIRIGRIPAARRKSA